MIKKLSTPIEVIAKGMFENNFDPNLVEPFIVNAEYRHLAAVDSFFGIEFYNALLADGVAFVPYTSTTTYNSGDKVIYSGKYYNCTTNGTLGIVPTDTNNWATTPKFATAVYQTLWDLHLQEFVALAVQHSSTFKNAYRTTSKGVMRNEGDTSKPAEYNGVKALKDEILGDVAMVRERMDIFLRTNKDDYPLYRGNKCTVTTPRNSRIGLYLKKKPSSECCEE